MNRRNLMQSMLGLGVLGISLPKISLSQAKSVGKLQPFVPQASGQKEYFQHFIDSYGVDLEFKYFTNYYDATQQIINGQVECDLFVCAYKEGARLRKYNKILPLDFAKLPNYQLINTSIIGEYDETEKNYIVSIGKLYNGLAYNKQDFPIPPSSWGVIFDKAKPNQSIGWLNEDNTQIIQLACLYLGFGYNTANKNHLKIVRDLLLQCKSQNKVNIGQNNIELLSEKKISAFDTVTTTYFQNTKKNPQMGFVFPKEGIFQDEAVFVIPNNSKNIAGAYAMINYLNIPLVAKTLAESSFTSTPFEHIRRLTSTAYQTNKYLFPKQDKFLKIENSLYSDEDALAQKLQIWQEITKT